MLTLGATLLTKSALLPFDPHIISIEISISPQDL